MRLQVALNSSNGTQIVLKNPIMSAAGTFGHGIEFSEALDLRRLGAIVTNSFAITEGSPSPAKRFYRAEYGLISSFGANNMPYQRFLKEILPRLPHEETPVIMNLKAFDINEMAEFVSILSNVEELAAIEVNLNCPYGNMAVPSYWKRPETLESLLQTVRHAAGKKPLWIKAPTAEYPFAEVVRAAARCGADAFVSYNALGGCAIDVATRKYRSGTFGGGGYSGPGLKPYAVSCTRACASAGGIPIIGAGGIVSADDVLEHIMAGAHAVQVGSANLMRPDIMVRLIDALEARMDELNIADLREIRGCAAVE